jgi:hypothetical protein
MSKRARLSAEIAPFVEITVRSKIAKQNLDANADATMAFALPPSSRSFR